MQFGNGPAERQDRFNRFGDRPAALLGQFFGEAATGDVFADDEAAARGLLKGPGAREDRIGCLGCPFGSPDNLGPDLNPLAGGSVEWHEGNPPSRGAVQRPIDRPAQRVLMLVE